MQPKINTYKIRDRWEETACDYCGQPMEAGETAYQLPNLKTYCSRGCATQGNQLTLQRQAAAKERAELEAKHNA